MSAWTKFATDFFHKKQKQNSEYTYSDALKEASPLYKQMKKGGLKRKQNGGREDGKKKMVNGVEVDCEEDDIDPSCVKEPVEEAKTVEEAPVDVPPVEGAPVDVPPVVEPVKTPVDGEEKSDKKEEIVSSMGGKSSKKRSSKKSNRKSQKKGGNKKSQKKAKKGGNRSQKK